MTDKIITVEYKEDPNECWKKYNKFKEDLFIDQSSLNLLCNEKRGTPFDSSQEHIEELKKIKLKKIKKITSSYLLLKEVKEKSFFKEKNSFYDFVEKIIWDVEILGRCCPACIRINFFLYQKTEY